MKTGLFVKLATFIVLGAVIFVSYLYFFVGFNEIIEVFMSVNPYEYSLYYSMSIIVLLMSMLFYSMSWNELMKALSINAGLKRAFICCWLGNFVDLVVPFETVSGEITRTYLIHKETGGSSGKIVASVVVHRIITTVITLGGAIFASIFFIVKYEVSAEILYLLLAILLGSLFLIGSLLYLALMEETTRKIIDLPTRFIAFITRGRFNLLDLRKRAYRNLMQFHEGFKSFGKNWRVLMKSIIFSFIAWILHLSIYFLVFYALGFSSISAKIYETIIVYSISVSVQNIPIAFPLGLVEIVMTSLYMLFKIPAAIGGTATLLIRVITFWLQISVGYVIAQWMGVKNLFERKFKETST
ncbi:MAG: lysylphosphatidylglycerol synthase transmembrane domain-containing protein [Candidatus Bathyarchaeia archaeon]